MSSLYDVPWRLVRSVKFWLSEFICSLFYWRIEAEDLSLIPGLPDELALQCLVRVSFQNESLRTMRAVCRRWRSMFLNSDSMLFKERFRLNLAEPSFFIVPWVDAKTLKCKSGFVCVPYKSFILIVGGTIHGETSSEFLIADTISHRVKKGPNMIDPRQHFACGVVDDRLFVMGGYNPSWHSRQMVLAECYDFESQVWTPICPMPFAMGNIDMLLNCYVDSSCMPAKIFVSGHCRRERLRREVFCYCPATDSWMVIDVDPPVPLFFKSWRWICCSGRIDFVKISTIIHKWTGASGKLPYRMRVPTAFVNAIQDPDDDGKYTHLCLGPFSFNSFSFLNFAAYPTNRLILPQSFMGLDQPFMFDMVATDAMRDHQHSVDNALCTQRIYCNFVVLLY